MVVCCFFLPMAAFVLFVMKCLAMGAMGLGLCGGFFGCVGMFRFGFGVVVWCDLVCVLVFVYGFCADEWFACVSNLDTLVFEFFVWFGFGLGLFLSFVFCRVPKNWELRIHPEFSSKL
jgi:hypothetical protein